MKTEEKNTGSGINDFIANALDSFVNNAEDTGTKLNDTIENLEKGWTDYKNAVVKSQKSMLESAGMDAKLGEGLDEFYDNAIAFTANAQKWGAAIAMTVSVSAAKAASGWLKK